MYNCKKCLKTYKSFKWFDKHEKQCKSSKTLEEEKVELKVNYGENARKNGLQFEKDIVNFLNDKVNIDKKNEILSLIKVKYLDLDEEGKFCFHYNKKVDGVNKKKTTRKSDIFYETKKYKIQISVKMSNKGTQLQIVSYDNLKAYLGSYGIKIQPPTEEVFKKFLGIIKPSRKELNILNKNRTSRNKNKYRYWLSELSVKDQERIVEFLKTNYSIIMRFILCDGMCLHDSDKAEFFILNDSYFTKTNKISIKFYNYNDFLNMISGNPKITKKGNLELSPIIGLQRKGSGKGYSAECLQFKDRGLKKIL